MADDVTTLGIGVDSSGVRRASDDMDKMTGASKRSASATTDVEKQMRRATAEGVILGEAIGNAVVKVLGLASSFVKLGLSVGRYQDIAEKTQSDPAGLASFRTDADVAGVSIDSVGLAINRMTLQLSKSKDDTKAAGAALKSIGLEIEQFKRLSPEEQFRTLAVQLNKYADGQRKVEVLQAIMGRGGAEQLVIMKEIAKQQEQAIKLSNEQIGAADDLSDAIARNKSNLQQAAEFMALGTLPALEAVTGAIKDAVLEMVGFDSKTKTLDNSAVREYAFDIASAFAFMADSVRGSTALVLTVAKTLGAGTAQLKEFFLTTGADTEGNDRAIQNIKAIGKAWQEDVGDVLGNLLNGTTMQQRVETQIAAIRARMARAVEGPSSGDFSRLDRGQGVKPQAGGSPDPPDKSIKRMEDAYRSLMVRVRDFTAEQKREQESTEALTAGQRLQIQVKNELDKLTGKGLAGKKASAEAAVKEALAEERKNLSLQKSRQAAEELRKTNRDVLSDLAQLSEQAHQSALEAEYQAFAFGKTNEQLEMLEIRRLEDTAAELQRIAAIEAGTEAEQAANAVLLERSDALQREANARKNRAAAEKAYTDNAYGGAMRAIDNYSKHLKEEGLAAEEATSRVIMSAEESFLGLVQGQKNAARNLIDTIISEFLRLRVIKPIMAEVFGDGSSGGLGVILRGLLAVFGGGGPGASNGSWDILPAASSGGAAAQSMSGRTSATAFRGGDIYVTIDSSTDKAQIAQMVQEGVTEGNRQFAEQLNAVGAL